MDRALASEARGQKFESSQALLILSAAMMVFSIKAHTVMGPTPPGTGVIAEALFLADSKSTSPHSFPSMFGILDSNSFRKNEPHMAPLAQVPG